MAWLDADYTPDQLATATSSPDVVAEWLRGRHRGFLAGIAVGTWDQAALAVLPHRFMALRWLGLSGKTVIIDEVHAYDAHGHALTLRLLEWLGALGVPVVLLSATVTGDTAAALVHAYRRGAGHHDTPPVNPSYPGWTYTDHTSGTITTSPTLGSNRAHPLTIDTLTCTHTHNPDHEGGRACAVLDLLAPSNRLARAARWSSATPSPTPRPPATCSTPPGQPAPTGRSCGSCTPGCPPGSAPRSPDASNDGPAQTASAPTGRSS